MQQFRASMMLAALIALALPGFAGEPVLKPLFNGKNLSGWVPMHGGEWAIEEGVLVGRNGTNWTTNPEYSGSWLRTEREYGDFVLELEYSIGPKSNSGIHFRSALEKNPSFTGYEMQINDDAGREPRMTGTGSLYALVAPSRNASKPAGEWNQVRIECSGERIRITLNGERIVEYTGSRSTRGYIGLQNHDRRSVVRFRNIRLAELAGDQRVDKAESSGINDPR